MKAIEIEEKCAGVDNQGSLDVWKRENELQVVCRLNERESAGNNGSGSSSGTSTRSGWSCWKWGKGKGRGKEREITGEARQKLG
jgi:hypothetical protein